IQLNYQKTTNGLRPSGDKENLTTKERTVWEELRKNTSIVIKPVDKSSATVIMDKVDYVQEALHQLNDRNYYIPLQKPIYQQTTGQDTSIYYQKSTNPLNHGQYLTKYQRDDLLCPIATVKAIHSVAEYLDSFLTPLSNRPQQKQKNHLE
uniref:Uncharacterized protein n=1 Tax=Amphiprion ocellaris TaxID=80972 RepID=A0AAQ5YBK5_AMPOC